MVRLRGNLQVLTISTPSNHFAHFSFSLPSSCTSSKSGNLIHAAEMNQKEMDRKKAFPKFPELKTRRLVLREIKSSEAEWYLEHFSRKEIVEGQGFPAPDGTKGAREELEQYIVGLFRSRSGFRWGIQIKGHDDLIGSLGFYNWEKPYGHKAKMGYDLDIEYWGRGIMAEAMSKVIDFGFSKMKLTRIELTVMRSNKRSMRMAKRLGFKREGILRQYGFNEKMEIVDEELYSMLRQEWSERGKTSTKLR